MQPRSAPGRARRRDIPRQGLVLGDRWLWLLENHPILAGFCEKELALLRQQTMLFLHEKIFEAAEGLELNEDMRSVIAVQACLPVLNLGLDWYENWKTVVVVPGQFIQELSEVDRAGVVHEWEEDNSGESWERGPVVLSWRDVEDSGWGDGYNVVIHEAAHKLDGLDGALNGRPALHQEMSPGEWLEVFSAAFQEFKCRLQTKKRQDIDSYAAEDDAEFFAVMSEIFFERPRLLLRRYPEVYRLLGEFYRQDPAKRLGHR